LFEPDKFDVKLSSDEWHRVYEKLVKGQVDVVVPVAVLEERKDYIYYSKPILTRHVGLYTKKGFSKNVSLENLKKLKIGVLKSDYTEDILKEKLNVKIYNTYPTVEDLIFALANGKIEAALMDSRNSQLFHYKE